MPSRSGWKIVLEFGRYFLDNFSICMVWVGQISRKMVAFGFNFALACLMSFSMQSRPSGPEKMALQGSKSLTVGSISSMISSGT